MFHEGTPQFPPGVIVSKGIVKSVPLDHKRKRFYSSYFLVVAIMLPQQWMASVDLNDAYLHIGVVPAHRQYLRLHWLGQSYQFRALPFGLTSARRVFTPKAFLE